MLYTKKTKNRKVNKTRTINKKPNFDKEAVYIKNLFSPEIFNKIISYTSKVKNTDMYLDPKASGRGTIEIDNSDPIIPIILNKKLVETVRTKTGNNRLKPCYSIPVEYRKYVKGSYMKWHRDTQMLPDQLQYECVITLTNNSDSLTLLEYESGIKKINTEPNSLLIVRAQGINHKVTKLTKGERTIIKLVFSE